MTDKERIDKALELAFQYGQIDGSHHKEWVIDQMVRILTDDHYDAWIGHYKDGDQYEWETGIAP
jgi:hypothetical protein